eukprot:1499652-Amphidinium_carterae.2
MSLETLWMGLQRQRPPSRFLEFLRQGSSVDGAEALPSPSRESVLPCGLPYDTLRGSPPSSGRRRSRWHRVRHRRQWINASVAYLDWLFLGKPSGRRHAWASSLAAPLTSGQWLLVGELERIYMAVCRLGEPPDLPSGGLKHVAEELCHSKHLGYGDGASLKSPVVPVELTEVNLSLPEVAGVVPLRFPVIPKVFEDILETPQVFLREEKDMPLRLPPWYMNVACWPRIAYQLLDRGLCRPVHPSEAMSWQGHHLRAGLFGVEKPQTHLRRVIVDRRRRNAIERCLRQIIMEKAKNEHWSPEELEHAWRLMTLPHGSQLTEILCSPGTVLRCWSEDARDYFYLLRYADIRHAETIIGYDIPTEEFTADELVRFHIPSSWASFSLALISPAMGDQKSMEVAQLCHQHVMLGCGGIDPEGWISYRWTFPSSSIVSGCYCDDFGLVAAGADDIHDEAFRVDTVMEEARRRIAGVHSGYDTAGLIRKAAKARVEEPMMTLWGSTVDGSELTVRGALDKIKPLVVVTIELVGARTASSDEVSSLLGHWTHHCLYRRNTLCLLDETYAWVRRDSKGGDGPRPSRASRFV